MNKGFPAKAIFGVVFSIFENVADNAMWTWASDYLFLLALSISLHKLLLIRDFQIAITNVKFS